MSDSPNAIFTIDVSHHDWNRRGGNLDWRRLKRDGITVMCARATYGDPSGYHPLTQHFGDFQTGAKAAGFALRGGYHNLVRGDAASMKRQVTWFRSELDRYDCDWAMLDVERYEELVSNGLWPRWEDVLRFRDAWAAQDSRPLAYYLPRWLWDGYLGRPDLRQLHGPLVASNYGSNGDGAPAALYADRGGDTGPGWQPYGGVTPTLWQFGSNCDVPGASGATDINAFRGSVEQLRALLTGAGMTITTADAEVVWKRGWKGPDGVVRAEADVLNNIWEVVTRGRPDSLLTVQLGRIEAVLPVLLAAVKGDDDTAAILAGVDERLAAQRQQLVAELVPAIVAALPDDGPVSRDDLIAALTHVLGSVDGASPPES